MNILLFSKAQVEEHLKIKAVMTPNLLGMNLQGEKAFRFSSVGISLGYEITVGFFQDAARYAAFKRKSSGSWNEADTRASLMQIGPWEFWSGKPGSDFFDYSEKADGKTVATATGWQTPKKKYLFVYIPIATGGPAVVPDKAMVDMGMS